MRFLAQHRATLRSFWVVLLFVPAIGNVTEAQPRGHGKLLTISVLVNGEAGMFLVDTGAARSAVDHAFAQRLGLKTTASARIRRNFSVEDAPIVAVSLEFANRTFLDAALLEIDLQWASQTMSVTIAGVLGTDFLSNACVKLRYSSGTAEVVDAPDRDALPVNVRNVDGTFFVPVRIGTSIAAAFTSAGISR